MSTARRQTILRALAPPDYPQAAYGIGFSGFALVVSVARQTRPLGLQTIRRQHMVYGSVVSGSRPRYRVERHRHLARRHLSQEFGPSGRFVT